MDLNTDAGNGAAEAPAHSPSPTGALVAMTPPADTPARISTSEAARLLASLRKPKESPATVNDAVRKEMSGNAPTPRADAVEARLSQESPPARAEDDAAPPPEEATGETQDADPAETPPIEPPRSWNAEAKARWAALDPDTQQYLLERDRTDSAAIRKAQNEAAEKLRGLTAKEQAVEQARQHYEAALPQLFQTLQSQQAGQFADIKTMADVERLAAEDWPRYLQWDVQQKKLAAVQQEYLGAQQRQSEESRQKFADFAKRQDSLFAEKIPDMADPKKAAAMQTAALRVLSDIGFEDGELQRAWGSQGEFSLRDHRVQMLIVDAVRWRDAQAKAKTVTAKPVPPVQRPGTAQPRGAGDAQNVQNLTTQLERSSGVNALRIAAKLVAARRAAAR